MRIRTLPAVLGAGLVYGIGRVIVTLNVERAVESTEHDTVLVQALEATSRFFDYIFDPAGAWIIWLVLGTMLGGHLYSSARGFEDRMRGGLGGPPFWYLRLQARLVRVGINHRWWQRLNRDLDANLENLSSVLTQVHGLPMLPATHFQAPEDDLVLTGEYLRLVIPNLSAAHINEARATAGRFVRRSKKKRLASLSG